MVKPEPCASSIFGVPFRCSQIGFTPITFGNFVLYGGARARSLRAKQPRDLQQFIFTRHWNQDFISLTDILTLMTQQVRLQRHRPTLGGVLTLHGRGSAGEWHRT
jgi:hypothetical protein